MLQQDVSEAAQVAILLLLVVYVQGQQVQHPLQFSKAKQVGSPWQPPLACGVHSRAWR